jgi:diguanylate cyclase (GGDEF)-like protein
MSDERLAQPPAEDHDAEFRDSRLNALISLNLNSFWSIAIILLAFGLWDLFVDPANWRRAFAIRVIGAVIIVATGLFQKRPGKAGWLPLMARVRLVTAAVISVIAAAQLNDGYGFGIAGLIVIMLTGPYSAIDARDLRKTNLAVVIALLPVMLAVPLRRFDVIGTGVFVLLGVAVSMLLGRVLEASHRRAFALEREQHRDARTDALTGLHNRRAMQERGRAEIKRAKRVGTPVSVILCDLDHFKSINDRYGHEAGDITLVQAAGVLREALRESDALGRWGGEEFMAVLPGTDARGAGHVAERMRAAIEATKFGSVAGSTTISLGVATSELVDDPLLEWDLLLKEADQRLYRAKHDGRNRVVAD